MSRHCTSGRPASIITENCRVNTARLFVGTPLPRTLTPAAPLAPAALALAFVALIFVTRICSRRSIATAASTESASRSPLTTSPARVRPEKANVGIRRPRLQLPTNALTHSPKTRLTPLHRYGRASETGARHHPGAAVDHLLQFVLVRRG